MWLIKFQLAKIDIDLLIYLLATWVTHLFSMGCNETNLVLWSCFKTHFYFPLGID